MYGHFWKIYYFSIFSEEQDHQCSLQMLLHFCHGSGHPSELHLGFSISSTGPGPSMGNLDYNGGALYIPICSIHSFFGCFHNSKLSSSNHERKVPAYSKRKKINHRLVRPHGSPNHFPFEERKHTRRC